MLVQMKGLRDPTNPTQFRKTYQKRTLIWIDTISLEMQFTLEKKKFTASDARSSQVQTHFPIMHVLVKNIIIFGLRYFVFLVDQKLKWFFQV